MPWFPDFVSAVELARRQTRAAGQADPIGQHFTALNESDTRVLETVWPGEVVVNDPRAGEIRGHSQLRRFVRLAHLADDGRELAWPVAVVAESPDDLSVVFDVEAPVEHP